MLNYVWTALLVLGIGAALFTDLSDQTTNRYKNGETFNTTIVLNEPLKKGADKSFDAELFVKADEFNKFYGERIPSDFKQKIKITFKDEDKALFYFLVNDQTPEFWREMASATGKENDLAGKINNISFVDSLHGVVGLKFEKIAFAKMKDVTNAAIDYAQTAVTIALGLIGIMALWLGVMKVAEQAGLIRIIARAVRPITKFLFPDVPSDHPAMGSIIMNISANMLGLGNAATPFGLKAMEELESLNENKGVATNAMVTFLAINTAGLTLIPATAIAIRAAAGSVDPTIIIGTSIFGALCATTTAVILSKLFEKFTLGKDYFKIWLAGAYKKILTGFFIIALFLALIFSGAFSFMGGMFDFVTPESFKTVITVISTLAIPAIIFSFIVFGVYKKVNVYESFVEGAKEGFEIAVKIIPYLVGMLVAIGIFRAGGMMDVLQNILAYPAQVIGMPPEALPMALIRPLSGSGSAGVMAEIMTVYGPDSLIGIMVSTFFGSTETTFYVLAVYFGAVNIRKTRHALFVGLMADLAGILGAVFIVNLLFG